MAKPPATFLERLRFLGPGIIFAAFSIGSGELLLTPRSGALYGYMLLWVPVITIIFKYTFTLGMSRFTVARGRDIYCGFSEVPGPRHWANYLVFVLFILEMIGHGGIALLSGTALYALFGIDMRLGGTLGVLLVAALLWGGSYDFMENVVKVMSVILIAGVIYNVAQAELPVDRVMKGLVPRIPNTADGLLTIMGLMGWIASGTGTLLYSGWLHEKMGADGPDESTYKLWMKTAKFDMGVSYFLIGAVSFAFLVLGVYVLGGSEVGFKGGRETMMALSAMLEKFPYGRQVFLVTAYFTLISTIVSGVDGRGRAFSSILNLIKPGRFDNKLIYRATIILYCSIMLIVCWTGAPVKVITVIAACSGVGFAIFGFLLIYLDTKLARHARGVPLWYIVVGLGSTLFLGMALYKSYGVVTNFFGA